MESRDLETHDRLLSAAARLFADRGFKRVTVRDICREAGANVAAVNYHFDDKLELYRQVLRTAVNAMRATLDAAQSTGNDAGAEERMRNFIHVFLQRVAGSGRDSWIHRLMSRELADPTPALDVIVQQAILPRITYLRALVAELLSCPVDDERVIRCAHSIHAQCVAVIPNPVAARLYPDFRMTPAAMTALAEHIAAFSIAGVKAMRAEGETRKVDEVRAAKDRASRRNGGRRQSTARPRSSRQL
jgi:AcrR family transcriptional regulator